MKNVNDIRADILAAMQAAAEPESGDLNKSADQVLADAIEGYLTASTATASEPAPKSGKTIKEKGIALCHQAQGYSANLRPVSLMRTKEKIFADALFRNTVDAPYTQQPIISWEDEFGYQQATGTIKTNVSSGDPLRSLDDAVTAAKVRMGGLAGQLDGFVLFAGSNVYRGIKYHPDVRQNVQYGVLDRDVLFNKEVLPAFSTFLIDNVRVVEVTDQNLYGIGPDQSFLVPRFSRPMSSNIALPFGYVATATSRDLDLSFAEPVDFRIWSLKDKFNNMI